MKEREFHIFVLVIASAIFLWPFIILANFAPVPQLLLSYEAEIGEEILFDASSSFDSDGDELIFLWDFGDGSQSQGSIAGHVYNDIGEYNVYLSIADGTDLSLVGIVVDVIDIDQSSDDVSYSNAIVINELLPNPSGSDDQEWIELFNKSNEDVDLSSWILRDESGKDYVISADDFVDTYIPARSFL